MQIKNFLAFSALVSVAICTPLSAQAPTVRIDTLTCVPSQNNAPVAASLSDGQNVFAMRTYFRWNERSNFYYVEMESQGNGAFWSVLPKPEERNEQVEVYVTAHNADGTVLAKSPTVFSEVSEDCQVSLTPQQVGYADNLVIGETSAAQMGEDVLGFLCDGIVTRINVDGVLRADEVCRACVIGALQSPPPSSSSGAKKSLAAAGLLFGGGVVSTIIVSDEEPPEISPSEPN